MTHFCASCRSMCLKWTRLCSFCFWRPHTKHLLLVLWPLLGTPSPNDQLRIRPVRRPIPEGRRWRKVWVGATKSEVVLRNSKSYLRYTDRAVLVRAVRLSDGARVFDGTPIRSIRVVEQDLCF